MDADKKRPPLVIFDLNGVLLDRVFKANLGSVPRDCRDHASAKMVNRFLTWRRPHCDEFLDWCFEHFTVAVWTSAAQRNARALVDYVFGKERAARLFFVFDQSHCTAVTHPDPQAKKPLFLKELRRVYDMGWPQDTVLLVDDTMEKAQRNPDNTCFVVSKWSVTDQGMAAFEDTTLAPDGSLRAFLTQWKKKE